MIKFASQWRNNPIKKKLFLTIVYGTIWHILKARNELVFKKNIKSPPPFVDDIIVVDQIIASTFIWLKERGYFDKDKLLGVSIHFLACNSYIVLHIQCTVFFSSLTALLLVMLICCFIEILVHFQKKKVKYVLFLKDIT